MTAGHIHLLITHLPIFGGISGSIVLAFGVVRKNMGVVQAAYLLFIMSAIGACIAYATGESAEDMARNMEGVLRKNIHEHEEAAGFALGSFIALGVASLIGVYSIWKNMKWSAMLAKVILFLSLFSFSVVARTGYLGGQIRHTEINEPVKELMED